MSKVTVKSSVETKITNGEGRLLELSYDDDLPITFGCQSGKCGICVVKVIEGELAPPSKVEEAILEGFGCEADERLACQAHIAGDVVLESIHE
ncbi:MAG: ferredoxin [Myxococcota bacterium]|jgi:ferredoxin